VADLILHGWTGSGPEHWQTWLAARLRARGRDVRYPCLPDPDEPRLDRWLAALEDELDAAGPGATVLCHSLACVLWFHHAARRPEPAGRVLLVAPPGPDRPEPAMATFFPPPFDADAVRAAAGETTLVFGDDDPYCPERADRAYPGLDAVHVPGGAHLNTDAGYGPWPFVEEWALRSA
jgi:predicted alpha/beta hydrolase family esterase